MRIVFISDTHLRHTFAVPDGDVLIHCGDGTMTGTAREIDRWAVFLAAQPHQQKIAIAGNHDILFETNRRKAQAHFEKSGAIYLQDSSIVIEGVKFYGSPHTPWFNDWAFNVHRGRALSLKWDRVPRDTDVLITHGPPEFMLDLVDGLHVGSAEMWDMLEVVKPVIHAFGHLHDSHGTQLFKETLFVNAAILDDSYKIRYEPVVVDLDPATKKAIVVE